MDYSTVLKLAPDRDVFDVVAGVGWDDGTVGSATVEATAESQAGYTLSVSDPVVVEDTAAETRFSLPTLLSDHDVRSGISVVGPTDDPWGVFGTHSRTSREFSSDEVTFVKNAVNVLATAIERQRAEQRLRDSEARFREIAELSPDAVFRMTVDGTIEYVSPVVEALLGYDPDDLVGDHFASLLAPGPTESVFEHFERVTEGEIVRGFETTLADSDGADVPVEINASPVAGPDGAVTAVQGLVRDVSERKARAEELELKERVLTAAPIGITISDATAPDNPLVYANDSFRQLTGYRSDDIHGQNCRFLQGPATDDGTVDDLRTAIDAGESLSCDILNYRQDGTEFWNGLTIAPVEDEDGTVANFVGFQQDVTDRHQYEQVLSRLHECSQELSRAEDVAAICAIAAETTTELLEFDGTVVYEFDGDTQLSPVAQSHRSGASPDLESCDSGLVWETFTGGTPTFFESVEAADGTVPPLPFASVFVVPVHTHGVLVTGTTSATTLSPTQRETANLLRESVHAALDGVEHEQERRDRIDRMRQQNDRLEQLDRLNGIIRDTVRTVVQSKSGADIWRGVCETFASTPQYTAAWVGRYDTATGGFEIEHWDGLDAEYVEYLRTNDGESPIRDMVAEVARTQTVQTARNILENDAWEPLRGHALNTGYRSVAVVPIAHTGEHATVLVIYGTETDPFEPRDGILDELGDIIGYAVQNLAGGRLPRLAHSPRSRS
ncbi:PAS domain S-box protein [Halomicroarcula sp. GCM10025710]